MSVAGPVVPQHPATVAGLWAAAAGGDDDEDPRRWRLKSAHEADVVPIRRAGRLYFACEACGLAFATEESVKAHHGKRAGVFLTMRIDPDYDLVLVETFTMAQAAAVIRASRARPRATPAAPDA